MRVRWYGLIGLVLVSFSSIAFGEQIEDRPSRILHTALVYDGVPGFWFERGVGLEILADLRELPVRTQQVSVLTEELALRMDQIERMRILVELEHEVSSSALNEIESAERRIASTEESMNKWWRSPWFLVSVGAVGIILVELVAVVLFMYVFH